MPARTLPEEALNTQVGYLLVWLEKLLGVKDTPENEKRIKFLVGQIKETAWGLSITQIMDAFKLYVDGKLSENGKYLEPISGFIDTIHFKKVIRAYKNAKAPKMDLKAIVISVNERYNEKGSLRDESQKPINGVSETFDHLYEIGLLPDKKKSKEVTDAYHKRKIAACGYIIAPLIDKKRWFEKEGLKGVPGHKEVIEKIETVKNYSHPEILPLFKLLVLEGYFKKLKKDGKHLKELI
ncbi:hypothetical protein [Flagellimonas sp. CMM7]|nr:hypothetical protein [Flagellimonas sp. CMM7]